MIRLDVELDLSAYDEEYRDFMEVDFRPALVDAVNIVGKEAVEDLRIETQVRFDEPAPFTQNAFSLLAAKDGGTKDPAAFLRVKPQQAKYFELKVGGGTRHAGDYGTTYQGAVVPVRDASTDHFDNLSWVWVAHFTGSEKPRLRGERTGCLRISALRTTGLG